MPSSPTGQPSRSAVATASATSAASRPRRSSASASSVVRARRRRARAPSRGSRCARAAGVERLVRRLRRRAAASISAPNTWLTQSMTGATVRKLVVQRGRGRRRLRRGAAGKWRCRPGGTGRSTASGRRRRTAARARARRPPSRRPAARSGSAGDAHGELDLDRVGVLELVEQQALVALVERGADVAPCSGRAAAAGEHEQVVELERAGGARGLGRVEREPPADRADEANSVPPRHVELVARPRAWMLELLGRAGRRGASPPCRASSACCRYCPSLGEPAERRERASSSSLDGRRRGSQFGVPCRRRRPHRRPAVVDRAAWRRCVASSTSVASAGGRRRAAAGSLCRPALVDQVPVLVESGGDTAQRLVQPEVAKSSSCTRSAPLVEAPPAGRRSSSRRAGPPSVARRRARSGPRRAPEARAAARPRPGTRSAAALGERVQRADRGVVEIVERGLAACARSVVGRVRPALGARRRWRRSAAAFSVNVMAAMPSIATPASDEVDDAADEAGRLARARAGLHEQVAVELVANAIAIEPGRAAVVTVPSSSDGNHRGAAGRAVCVPIRHNARRCRASRARSTGIRCGTGTAAWTRVGGEPTGLDPGRRRAAGRWRHAPHVGVEVVADALVAAALEERVLGAHRLECRELAGPGGDHARCSGVGRQLNRVPPDVGSAGSILLVRPGGPDLVVGDDEPRAGRDRCGRRCRTARAADRRRGRR